MEMTQPVPTAPLGRVATAGRDNCTVRRRASGGAGEVRA